MAGSKSKGRPLGTHPLWGWTSLPVFFRERTRDIAVSRGRPESAWTSEDIAAAVRLSKRWAAGEGKVSLKTRARAAAAVAEWERKKAQNAARKGSAKG